MVDVFFRSDSHLGFWVSGFGELSEATDVNFAHGVLSDVGLSLSLSVFAASHQPSAFPSACENGVLDESDCASRWALEGPRTQDVPSVSCLATVPDRIWQEVSLGGIRKLGGTA